MRFAQFNALLVLCLTVCFVTVTGSFAHYFQSVQSDLQLGNFSVSLSVKDLNASKAFYEKLGFKQIGGDLKRKYVILQNETSTIGLYQGIFERNMLTYNPGWDRNCKTLESFQDVRDLQ